MTIGIALTRLDRRILMLVQQRRPKFLNRIFILLTFTGTGRAWWASAVALGALTSLHVRIVESQRQVLIAFIAPFITWGLGSMIKKRVGRKRPSHDTEGLAPLIENPTCGSFPSTHAASTVSFFIALSLMGHPLAPAVAVWAALVSFSRISLGVHYLSDVIGGVVLGAACGYAVAGLQTMI